MTVVLSPEWTPEENETLKRLWPDKGLSAADIAEKIPGRSRNAVIGRAQRLDLPARPGMNGNPGQKRKDHVWRRQGKVEVARVKAKRKPPRKPAAAPKAEAVKPLMLSVMALQAGDCRFVYGDFWRDKEHSGFCGHPAILGTSWCQHHAALVFQPRPR